MLKDAPVSELSARLSSVEPAPGGGSASAAVAALGASLLVMTCNLTVGRERYRDAEEELVEARDELEPIRVMLLADIDRDADAYGGVVEALSMVKGSPEEREARKAAIQEATRRATEVPLDVARRAARALDLASTVARLGNPNALSDAGCGARFLEAGLRGALYNVRINLPSIRDEAFVSATTEEVSRLAARADEALVMALSSIEPRL